MSNDIQTGHEHLRPRGAVIVLNAAWSQEVGQEGVSRYIDCLIAATKASEGKSPEEVEQHLLTLFKEQHLDVSQESTKQRSEQIASANGIQVLSHTGQVLYSYPQISQAHPSERDPGVRGTEDPEHPDRPAFGA